MPGALMSALRSNQKRHLRGLGHQLDPVVQIGHRGLTDAVVAQVDQALTDHELIKVRIGQNTTEKRDEVGRAFEERVSCALIQSIGRVLLLYRQAEDPEDRRIKLPAAKIPETSIESA